MESQTKSAVIGILIAIIAGLCAYTLWPVAANAPTDIETGNASPEVVAKAEKVAETSKPQTKTKSTPKPASPPVTQGGTYEVYSPEKLGYAALGEVILFIYSSSCPACVLLDKDILTNAARIPKDVKILKVDFDTATDITQKYGLSTPHILIQVNSKGDRITQWGLSSTLSDLVTRIVRY